jgi:hypothetical protein
MTKAQQEISTKQEVHVAKDITPINVIKRDTDQIKDNEAKLRAAYEYDSVPVRIVFRRLDGSPDPLEFTFLKHKWDKLTRYRLIPGQVHTIPRGVAEWLRDGCKTPIYGEKTGGIVVAARSEYSGNMPEVVGYNSRFAVSSLDFTVDNRDNLNLARST